MGELRKKNENNKSMRNVTVLHSATQLSVLKMNWLILAVMVGLMALVVFMGSVIMSMDKSAIQSAQAKKPIELYKLQMNPVLSAEVDALKSQLVGVVSGSIESKLKILEESLRTGAISEIGLETIHSLQQDVIVLKTYSKTGAGRLIAQKYLQEVSHVSSKKLADEVSQLKSLIHVLIASCGLMMAAVGGVWVRKRYALLTTDARDEEPRKIS